LSVASRPLPRPFPRREAAIELLDGELDEVPADEILLGLPELFLEIGLLSRLGARRGGRRRGRGVRSALHFDPDKPLPTSLVRKLLGARMAEGGRR
jgi:hypothetical protein